MTRGRREQLIDDIVAKTGGEVPRYRERLARLPDERLERMWGSLENVLQFGRENTVSSSTQSNRLQESLLRAVEEVAANMREWRAEQARTRLATTAQRTSTLTVAPGEATWELRPDVHRLHSWRARQRLARKLIESCVADVVPKLRTHALREIQELLEPTIADYLDVEINRTTVRAAKLIRSQLALHRGVSIAWDPHASALSVLQEPGLFLTHYRPVLSKATVLSGLARAAVSFRALRPSKVWAGPKSRVLYEFLKASTVFSPDVLATSPMPIAQTNVGAVILDAGFNSDAVEDLVGAFEREAGESRVVVFCLVGSSNLWRRIPERPLLTMLISPDEGVRPPWDGDGHFRMDGDRLIFGASTQDEFVVSAAELHEAIEAQVETTGT